MDRKSKAKRLALKTPFLTRPYRFVEKGAYLLAYGLFLGPISLAQRLPLKVPYGLASLTARGHELYVVASQQMAMSLVILPGRHIRRALVPFLEGWR